MAFEPLFAGDAPLEPFALLFLELLFLDPLRLEPFFAEAFLEPFGEAKGLLEPFGEADVLGDLGCAWERFPVT